MSQERVGKDSDGDGMGRRGEGGRWWSGMPLRCMMCLCVRATRTDRCWARKIGMWEMTSFEAPIRALLYVVQ